MARRSQVEYERLFNIIQQKYELNIDHVMIDLEIGARNALRNKFPVASITHCYYHFQESLYQWLCSNNMKTRYAQDDEFRFRIHLHGVLAFIPVENMIGSWTQLQTSLPEDDDDLNDFSAYFEQSFIGRMLGNGSRRTPKYSIQEWNQYLNVTNGRQRTNNAVEGWHNGLAHLSCSTHPNVFGFVEIIKKDMEKSRQKIIQLNQGQAEPPRRRTYKDFDLRVSQIVSEFSEESALSFLSNMANVYNFY